MTMFELRWFTYEDGITRLQYRTRQADITEYEIWNEWVLVPHVHFSDVPLSDISERK